MATSPSTTSHTSDQPAIVSPRKRQPASAHSPEPAKIFCSACAEGKPLEHVSKPGAARGYLVWREVLQPHLTARNCGPYGRNQEQQRTVDDRTTTLWPMQGADREHRHHCNESDTLQNAQRTRILLLVILQVQRESKQSRANHKTECIADACCHR